MVEFLKCHLHLIWRMRRISFSMAMLGVTRAISPIHASLRVFGLYYDPIPYQHTLHKLKVTYTSCVIVSLALSSVSDINNKIQLMLMSIEIGDSNAATSYFVLNLNKLHIGISAIPFLVFVFHHAERYNSMLIKLDSISSLLQCQSIYLRYLFKVSFVYIVIVLLYYAVALAKQPLLWGGSVFSDFEATMCLRLLHSLLETKFMILVFAKRWLLNHINDHIKVG